MDTKPTGTTNREPLAIVGLGCRFPGGAEDGDSFWKMLSEGRSGITEVPENRWNRERYYHKDTSIPRKMHTKWGGFVNNVDMFDAQFWGISPREALRMDPQQRWLLECTWEAIEDAGYAPSKLKGSRTGVYVGIASNDYAQVQMTSPEDVDVHTNSGSTLSIASNRIAYLLDLKGPALSVDTACSSALVAINIGCKDMWSGEIDCALVGGSNALLTPDTSIGFSKATMLSPSGQCFAFDDRANGYVRGEGAGMFMLVPLSKALEHRDRIYAVVRSAVINQDGNTSSMTVPGQASQEAMLIDAYGQAGMEPSRVTYMEAHGTGTPVGDPIETNALGRVLSKGRAEGNKCLIGSVKTNVGHLESGSGVAGLAKASLVLKNGMVPPNLNFERPNPNIDFETLKLQVVTEMTPLKTIDGKPPVAAVNSFGFGGTNSHIVLEAAPKSKKLAKPRKKAKRPYLLPISGKDDAILRNYAKVYRKFLEDPELDLAEVCYSAGARKEQFEKRAVVLGNDVRELRERLWEFCNSSEELEGVHIGQKVEEPSPVVFVFTGQGAQWWAMGQELIKTEPVFRKAIEDIDALIQPLGGWSLLEEMTRSEEDSNINRTYIAQPAIFALQVALAELWKSWGVEPSKVVGHSVGEVAAAYVAGAYTLEDAVQVIFHRSRLQETTGGHGRMAAVGLSEAAAKKVIAGREDKVEVAVVNSPSLVTLAGDSEPLEEIVDELEQAGTFVRWLRINYAFHTHQMAPIKDELLETLKDITPQPTKIPFISTVTGGSLRGEELDGHYWWRNVREAVLFAPAMMNLIRGGERLFVELGPHPALSSPISECLAELKKKGTVLHSLRRKANETDEMLTNLSSLHNYGIEVDWKALNQAAGEFVRQPSYPWNRERFWLESEEGHHVRCSPSVHPLLGIRIGATMPTWEFYLDPRLFSYLDDHRFWDSIIFPAAGYGEIGLAIAKQMFPEENYAVEELEAKKALFISESKIPIVRVVYDEKEKAYTVYSNASGNGLAEWEINAVGKLRKLGEPSVPKLDIESVKKRMERHFDHEQYYEDYLDAGYQFGPNFQHLQNVWRKKYESIAEIDAPEAIVETLEGYRFHPAILDACFHGVKGAQIVPDGAKPTDYFYLPAAIGRIRIFREPIPTKLWAHSRIHFDDGESLVATIFVYDEAGDPVAEVVDFRVDRMDQKDEADEELENSFYQFKYEPRRLKGSRVEGAAGLADISTALKGVAEDMPDIYKEYQLSNYYTYFGPSLDKLVVQAVINAFLKLGWKPRIGDQFGFDELALQLGIIEQHHRLFFAQLKTLESEGWLKSVGDSRWEVVEQPKYADVDAELEAMTQMEQFASEAELQQITCPALPDVLIGEEDPVELLFSGGSNKKMERFYREGADFPANNQLIQRAVREFIATMEPRRAIRILEVGAGTGSLTRAVVPALPADRSEYVFSDNGPTFILEAKKAFADYPFMEFMTFDVEKDPQAQGIEPGSYDIILATNVIHATSDLKNTLGNLKQCLAEDGILMFLEVVVRRPALNNVFGLLKGWWHYQDTDLRPNSAIMLRDQWIDLLKEMEFRDVDSFISSPSAEEGEQAVFIAKAPTLEAAEEEVSGEASGETLDSFLLLEDASGLATAVGDRLDTIGGQSYPVKIGEEYALADGAFTVNPIAEADWEKLFVELADANVGTLNIVHCWTLDHPSADQISLDELDEVQETGVHSLRALVRALHKARPEFDVRMLLVTRGRISVDGEALRSISAAPLTGFVRVANNEHPEWPIFMVDLDPEASDFEVQDVLDELTKNDGEFEIAYRADKRFVSRLHRVKAEEVELLTKEAVQPDGSVLPYRLEIDKPGVLQNLALCETPRIDPAPGEIEIQVKAGGINFRDVMKALGMYPGNPVDIRWFGDDISGTVVRVGEGVTDLKPGDNVVGMAPYAFRSFVTVNRQLVFKKPDRISFEEAATLPTVFLTSHYALVELARMEKGERVLIHAGTGGVGSAAIQIAKNLGLEIFATAGTDEKRALLKEMGVDHVMNSRTLDFADEIMEITNGEGIDCVLNSLAGDFIPKSFSVLRRFGRFVEIGKIDIYNNSKIGLECLKNNISYFVVDLAQHLESKPAFVANMLKELETEFYAGTYDALPLKAFPITEVVEAFRYMAQGKHVGKNVLNFDQPSIPIAPCTQEGHLFRDDCTYLITGGAGGFGFELAKWMADNGARHLALMSRSGPKDKAVEEIAAMEANGVEIYDARADVTDREGVKKIIDTIQKSDAPLGGIIHGAMVINDLDIIDLDKEGFDMVLRPKMLGAWLLHELTKDIPLDMFAMFSSFSTVMGAVRQSNYNAGNAFLDGMSQHRHGLGLSTLTFNWGALTGAGFVERNEKTAQYLEMLGLKPYNMAEAKTVFSRFIRRDGVNVAASRADWQSIGRLAALINTSKTYSLLVGEEAEGEGGAVRSQILSAAADSRAALTEDFLAEQVAGVFGTDVSKIDKDTPLNNLGLDSLMAIELMNRVESQLGIAVPMGAVLNGPNIRELAVPILETLLDSAGEELAEGGGDSVITGPSAGSLPPLVLADTHPIEFPLTEGQKALWFLHKLAPESPAYNLVYSAKITPLVDIEVMKDAFSSLYERHPMLDVTFHTVEGEPVQRLHKGRTIQFREHDATDLDDEAIKQLLIECANKPFDLEQGPVMRLDLFRTKDDAHITLLCMHHIISDAWSVTVFMNDLIEGYFAKRMGRVPEWEEVAAHFQDFQQWEDTHLDGESGARMLEYWEKHLAGAPMVLDLPTDRPRPAVQTFNGAAYGFKLDEDLTGKVVDLSKEQNATLFTTLLSAFEVLMHRYCSQEDLLVGVPLAGRNQPELHNMIGYFVNPVAVRSDISEDPVFTDYLSKNSETVVGALENQQFPLAKLVDQLRVPRDPSRSPVFQVSFSMEKIPGLDGEDAAVFMLGQGGHKIHIGDITVETVDLTLRQAQFEITLVVEEAGGVLYGCWQYNADLFDESTIEYLNSLYAQVLRQISTNPEMKISEINLLSVADESRILETWNATEADYPEDQLLHDLVTDQVARTPDKIAVRSGGDTMTFNQIDRKADGLAQVLAKKGIGPDKPVALLAERGCDMVVGTLGVLKSGGCYVPMDPEFPAYRLEQMLANAAPTVVVTQRSLEDRIPEGDWTLVYLEDVSPADEAPEVKGLSPDSLAYIIYTSGSTGVPKGVEIPHRAAVNFLTSMRNVPGLSEKDALLAVTTLSFDISLLEIYLPLLCGAEAVIASRDEVKDGRHLGHMLEEFDISVMQATPATWQMLIDGGWSGKKDLKVLSGGEPLPRKLANELAERAGEVWNLYGPTETTVWSTLEKVEPGNDSILVGKPIANTTIYVLDGNKRPVPAGFVGDLYIGGHGLARGYHNQPELTQERFVEVELPNGKTERVYETGDLARWTAEGKLECLGRSDFQVKLRGVRMELDDIEAHLMEHSGVRQAVVVKREDLPGGPNLVAYVIPESAREGLTRELRDHLRDRLPESMRPAFYSVLDEFPLTPNRKIDRKRLPAPSIDRSGMETEFVEPKTANEILLAGIFCKAFEIERIGIQDNFFEMGGDSLLAVRILAQASEAFNRNIPVEAFLRYPTIEQLARYLSSTEAEEEAGLGMMEGPGWESLATSEHLAVEFYEDATLPKVDAVALATIPNVFSGITGLSRDDIVEKWFSREPKVTSVYELPQGKIGLVVLPQFDADVFKDEDSFRESTVKALEMASEMGAKTVALTGILPTATDHGREVKKWIEGRTDMPEITTGDATRIATIMKTVEGALEQADREFAQEKVAFVGLGSVGVGTMELALEVLPHPSEILLCDPYKTADELQAVSEHVRELGYEGEITLHPNGGGLPPSVYKASFVIGTTNIAGVLDITKLRPGAILVDYSFPPSFRIPEAVRRFEEEGDILFTTGGEIRHESPIMETIFVPEHAKELSDEVEPHHYALLAGRDANEITGCVLVSLLTGMDATVKPTLGPAEKADILAHYKFLEAQGFSPARLQIQRYVLDSERLESFRDRQDEWADEMVSS